MPVRSSDLKTIPLFQGITDEHLTRLLDAFERLDLPAGHVLFEAGSAPSHFQLLVSGEVALREPGEGPDAAPRFLLTPLAPIGELGAVTGLRRNTTATTTKPSEVLSISAFALTELFEKHGDVAFPFYHNLLGIVADKVRRDERRLDEMRKNVIRTQKAMKKLLEHVLEAEETPLSKTVAETLEDLIEHNRRGHYLVEPPPALGSSVRLDGGAVVPVREMSDGYLRLSSMADAPKQGAAISFVLVTPAGEVPVSGVVEGVDAAGVLVKIDMLIEAYATILREHLTRVQMLDFVV